MTDAGNDDVLLTVKDVARLLKVSIPTVWRLIGSGEIPTVMIGERSRRVVKSDLIAYIESRRQIGGKS